MASVGPLLLAGLLAGCAAERAPEAPALRIATGPEQESRLLARTMLVLLAAEDVEAEVVVFADGRSARQAIELGDAELTVAYSGEEWLMRLGRADPPADPLEAFPALVEADRARGLVWLVPEPLPGLGAGGGSGAGSGPEEPPANATFAFFVAGPPRIDADLRTLSELSLRLSERPDLSLCVDSEFGRRTDGLAALLSAYSVRRDRPFLVADPAAAIERVLAGDCIAGLSHATDGLAWAAGMQPLADDLRFFPAFVPAPVVRSATLQEQPAVAEALAPMRNLSTGMLGRANGAVLAGRGSDAVAAELAERLRRTGR